LTLLIACWNGRSANSLRSSSSMRLPLAVLGQWMWVGGSARLNRQQFGHCHA